MKENSSLMAMPLLHKYYEDNTLLIITFTIIGSILFFCFGIGMIFIILVGPLMRRVVLQIALEYGFDENDIKNYQLEEFIPFDANVKKDNENDIKKI